MKTFALIPARGGSKGIPRKNIKEFAGKPLIVWTIEAALKSALVSSVVVSTDDSDIADIAREAGAQVPFMRPSELAQDDTPGIAPVMHAIAHLAGFSSVLLLQPTSPLRTTNDIDECLRLATLKQAESVVSVCDAETHPYWTYRITGNQKLEKFIDVLAVARRQDLPNAYTLNGAMYFAKIDWLLQSGTLIDQETLAYVMPRERSVDLDSQLDWKFAELLMKERL